MCEISREPVSVGMVKIALPSIWILILIEVLQQFWVTLTFRRGKHVIDEFNGESKRMLVWDKGGWQCHASSMVDNEDLLGFIRWYIRVQIMSVKVFVSTINMKVMMVKWGGVQRVSRTIFMELRYISCRRESYIFYYVFRTAVSFWLQQMTNTGCSIEARLIIQYVALSCVVPQYLQIVVINL